MSEGLGRSRILRYLHEMAEDDAVKTGKERLLVSKQNRYAIRTVIAWAVGGHSQLQACQFWREGGGGHLNVKVDTYGICSLWFMCTSTHDNCIMSQL